MTGAPGPLVTAASGFAAFFMLSPVTSVRTAMMDPSHRLREVAALNLWAIYMNCMLWCVYCFWEMPSGVPVNMLGCLAQVAFAYNLFKAARGMSDKDPKEDGGDWTNGKALQLVFYAIAMTAGTLGYAAASPWEGTLGHIGFVAMLFNIVMFGAPLAVIRQVLKERSSTLLPRSQCVLGLVCSTLWLAVAGYQKSMSMFVPNACGCLLNIAQLVLILIFPGSSAKGN
eukprot:TRINITY_DN31083_c0_g1_i1.p1 TRINITY_DN31083_c0_g1~~TRINITY_DN31083_c0_g1_i1.p1  ORF type:complete len:256 (-),score=36.74 TRINITY_DN31083_c0_g1_i1:76-756(-)